MNTLLSLTNNQNNIKYVTYNSIYEIINSLQRASKSPHEEYDSVKLYGSSEFIISILKCIIKSKKYKEITIASINVTSHDIDPECRDDYVLSICNNELYIQSAWNDNRLFENEAKFTICHSSVPDYIIECATRSCTPVIICNLSYQK